MKQSTHIYTLININACYILKATLYKQTNCATLTCPSHQPVHHIPTDPACNGFLTPAHNHHYEQVQHSTFNNNDNILKRSGSSISGTQTQISGSSPVKRALGTMPWLANLNQQRSRENDRVWTTALLTPIYLHQANASPISSFVSVSPSVFLNVFTESYFIQ